jgi:hypothetical protein
VIADLPPEVRIVKPDNDESVIIDGQLIEIDVEALDDLGVDGIEKVVFYVNDNPVQTVYESLSDLTGSAAQQHIYRAKIVPPQGVDGFVLQAVVYDVVGHSAQTQVVRVGRIEDTVRPKVGLLQPFDQSIITMGDVVRAVVSIEDIGSPADRLVKQTWVREYRDGSGQWVGLAEKTIELFRNDARDIDDTTPVSDPDNHYYIYWADFADGLIVFRGGNDNERVRVVTSVVTPGHNVDTESNYEVGFPVSEQRFFAPTDPQGDGELAKLSKQAAKEVYYTAIDQYTSFEGESGG